jgi:hypothetical protein
MSKEQVTYHEQKLREEFKELMKSSKGTAAVKKLVDEAEDFFRRTEELEPYMMMAHIAVKEVRDTRKLYYEHYSTIKQFVEFQRKLNLRDTDDAFILL